MTSSSPCVGVCRLEDGVCVGCGRLAGEVAAWPAADALTREKIRLLAGYRLAHMALRPAEPGSAGQSSLT